VQQLAYQEMLLATLRRPAAALRPLSTLQRKLSTAAPFAANAENFIAKVLQNPKPVVLDCQADWCGPCKTLAPILEAEIAKTQGKVLLATLDVDAEQELSGRLGVQQLPTVMGFAGGTVPKDGAGNPLVLVGAVPQPQVAQFVSLLASLAPNDGELPEDATQARVQAFQLLDSGNVPGAAEAFQGEYTRLRTMDENDRAKVAADPAAPRKSRGVEPLEYDSDRPESIEMAWCLYGLARCALENAPSEPEAADQILGALRDKRRKNVIDKEANLKAAVSRLSLALDGDAGNDDPLSAARRVFASGDVEGALDRALDAVKAAPGDDEREAARELCVTIIDAMGPGKESLRARKKLASVLF
jgi:putative thioredoxin